MALGRPVRAAAAAGAVVRIAGFVREVAFAAAFGASPDADALNAALRVPGLFRDLFAEGSLSHAFVPSFARAVHRDDADGWRLLDTMLAAIAIGAGALTLLTVALAGPSVRLVAAGFGPEKAALTASLIRWVAPMLVGIALASAISGALAVRGRMFAAIVAPGAMSAVVIAACLIPPGSWDALAMRPITGVAAATTLGAFLAAAIQLPSLWAEGWRPRRPALHPELAPTLAFAGPAVLGVATVQLGAVMDVQLAARLGDGAVAQLAYAFRVAQVPMNLFAGVVAVAGLAAISADRARGDTPAARRSTADVIGLTAYLVAPSAVGLAIFAHPAVALLYERGVFVAADTDATARLVEAYALGAVAFGVHRALVPAFFGWGDARTPMALSMAAVIGRLPFAIYLSSPDRFGARGIALSHAAFATLEVAALAIALNRRVGGLRIAGDLAKTAAGCVALAVVAWPFHDRTSPGALIALVPALGLAYAAFTAAVGSPHPRTLLARGSALPPHVDRTTRDALTACSNAGFGLQIEDGDGWRIETTVGTLILAAVDGALVARIAPAEVRPAAAARLFAVLDAARRPPPLVGLRFEFDDHVVSICVTGEKVRPGPVDGESIAIA